MQEAIRMRQGVRRGAAPSGHRRPRCVARPSESSPVPAAPAIDWTSVQGTYGQRFGDASFARIIYDAEGNVRFFILTFWRPERRDAPVVYATWGAPERELLLVAAVPYFAFEEFVQRAVTHTASAELSPLDVVQCAGLDTPFRAFLVAPPEEGTFSVEEPAGLRRVLRIVPLTPAEQTQAGRSPRQALDQLRVAGALVADPLRACRSDPEHTTHFREYLLRATVRRIRRECAERDAELARMRDAGAPPEQVAPEVNHRATLDAALNFFRERGPHVPTDAELLAGLEACAPGQRPTYAAETLLEYGFDILRPFATENSAHPFREFLGIVITSHPEIIIPFHKIVTGQPPPPDWTTREGFGRQVYMRLLTVADRNEPEHREGLMQGVFRGLVDARTSFDPKGTVAFARHLWTRITTAMNEGRYDASTLEGRAITRAIDHAIKECATLTIAADTTPPFLRLLELMEQAATSLLFGFCMFDSPEMGADEN